MLKLKLFFFSLPSLPSAPRHLVGNLPPYTNVSLKMILTNPEGRKESDETIIQTDEDGAWWKEKEETFDRSEFPKIVPFVGFCDQPQMRQMLLTNVGMLGGQI